MIRIFGEDLFKIGIQSVNMYNLFRKKKDPVFFLTKHK